MYENILRESGAYLTVLVVDEDCKYRNLLRKKLSKYFKKFILASNAKEAFSLYEDEPFDILIVDIDKESVDGLDLITKLKKTNSSQTIFLYSKQTENSSLLLYLLNIGITCFMNKAEKVESYIEIISNVCQHKSDQKMLTHYIEELESEFAQVQKKYPIYSYFVVKNKLEVFKKSSVKKDDLYIPPKQPIPKITTTDNSMYKDYFKLLESEDKEELHDLLIDIDTTLIDGFSDAGGNSDSIKKFGALLMHYGNVLMHYQFFSDMGTVILEFGKIIGTEAQKVAALKDTFYTLLSGFCSGLEVFMAEVWEQNSDNPKFFNDSIINDAILIKEMIIPPVVAESEDDLVFF